MTGLKEQICIIANNFYDSTKKAPFIEDLEKHFVYWQFLIWLSKEERINIQNILDEWEINKISSLKTKGWLLFYWIYEKNPILWKQFRNLNKEWLTWKKEFIELWKKIEQYIFEADTLLTSKMWRHQEWVIKVTDAFYNIVYAFFPYFNLI